MWPVNNKYQAVNGLGYYTNTKLFQSGICLILGFCCEIWEHKSSPQIDAIQNKAICMFLGDIDLFQLQQLMMDIWAGFHVLTM